MKKFYILILICAISFTLGICIIHNSNDKQPNLNKPTSTTPNTPEVKPGKYSEIDDILENQQYTQPTENNSKIYSVEIYNLETQSITSFKEYTAIENDYFDISIKNGETFIISLPTMPTVTYSWKILNSIDNNLLKLDNTSSVHLKSDDTNSGEVIYGNGHSLQNFYFSALNSGSQTINFELNSDAYKSTDNFRINLKINVVN